LKKKLKNEYYFLLIKYSIAATTKTNTATRAISVEEIPSVGLVSVDTGVDVGEVVGVVNEVVIMGVLVT